MLSFHEYTKLRRKSAAPRPSYWGAACMLEHKESKPKKRKGVKHIALCACLLTALGAFMAGIIRLSLAPKQRFPVVAAISESTGAHENGARPLSTNTKTIYYGYPEGVKLRRVIFTRDALLRGNMLIVDENHPLPLDMPPPNTLRVAAHGKGVVGVKSLDIKSSAATIDALVGLFRDARQRGMEGLTVTRGTLSKAEQLELQLEYLRLYAPDMGLERAARRVLSEIDSPGQSEREMTNTVDIRVYDGFTGMPDSRPLGMTEQGRYLLFNAWKHGFVQRYQGITDNDDRAYRLRYVGVAHAAAMRETGLSMDMYMEFLHQNETVLLHTDGAPRYLVLCKPMEGDYISFMLPEGVKTEASLDNMGYAVVACAF